MQIARKVKEFLELVFDQDLYFLAWVAIRNQWKKTGSTAKAELEEKEKRAKVFTAR
jgi:hypothetical protein